jgi:hypothetical protein
MRYDDVTGYLDANAAEELAKSVRKRLYGEGHDSPSLLQIELESMKGFLKAAGRTVTACQRQIQGLKTKQLALHGEQAAASFDHAIAQLDKISDRAADVRALLSETIRVGQTALNRWNAARGDRL